MNISLHPVRRVLNHFDSISKLQLTKSKSLVKLLKRIGLAIFFGDGVLYLFNLTVGHLALPHGVAAYD